MMVIGLVVLAMMIYIANKYILGGGKTVGELTGCKNQRGDCMSENSCDKDKNIAVSGMGCKDTEVCCLPRSLS
jgi:hypothetical protein